MNRDPIVKALADDAKQALSIFFGANTQKVFDDLVVYLLASYNFESLDSYINFYLTLPSTEVLVWTDKLAMMRKKGRIYPTTSKVDRLASIVAGRFLTPIAVSILKRDPSCANEVFRLIADLERGDPVVGVPAVFVKNGEMVEV